MHAQNLVNVLAILPSEEDQAALKQIVADSRWNLGIVERLRQARPLIDELDAGVVITDSRLPDGCWQDVLWELQCRRVEPVLIVASRLADDRLWAEVLNFGVYDLLATPFQGQELIRSVVLAWQQWQGKFMSREVPAGKVMTAGARVWW